MMRVIVMVVLMMALSACDSSKWVDVPVPLSCDELNKGAKKGGMSLSDERSITVMWGKAACLQMQKTYAGEVRCESASNLQVKCK
ncbi:MAG: hypothetical protein A3F73_12760 [Gallionellales bacterium RIFCSPLOWO2_12_FULL_59_22]|nr:MAG: hypothetical protein A2Z65_06670 [Gallionellales bacterium RIFCSPLOWO2_02_58_13]OGT12859.1 MAG: hypothetical protein A3F73_12760 [Gallionellales bacterium RIFCSPLOWO2_12_FULL_59_22]